MSSPKRPRISEPSALERRALDPTQELLSTTRYAWGMTVLPSGFWDITGLPR